MRATNARCTSADWRLLRKAKKESHKGENGNLLICAGSRQYHGSLILAIRAAVRFCDLVYVYCDEENRQLVSRLKTATPNIIILNSARALSSFLPRMDAVLAGPGWQNEDGKIEKEKKRLLALLLKTKKPIVLDAGVFDILAKRQLHEKILLTPHVGEFRRLFGVKATANSVRQMAKKYKCNILCKGQIDYIASPTCFKSNSIHHVGMTKGGSGDVLAGLCAAIMADHNKSFEAACAAAYLIGLCGVRLSKKMGAHYSSEDLVNELPHAARKIER